MTEQEAKDFIEVNHSVYINKVVYFESSGLTARVKAIEPIEGDNGEFAANCYLENPDENDPSFRDHIYSHLAFEDVISLGRIVQ